MVLCRNFRTTPQEFEHRAEGDGSVATRHEDDGVFFASGDECYVISEKEHRGRNVCVWRKESGFAELFVIVANEFTRLCRIDDQLTAPNAALQSFVDDVFHQVRLFHIIEHVHTGRQQTIFFDARTKDLLPELFEPFRAFVNRHADGF